MFSKVTTFIQGLQGPAKTLIAAIVIVTAAIFLVKPVTSAQKEFSDSNWGKGLMYSIACAAVVVMAFIATKGLYSLGKQSGNEINSAASSLDALRVLIPVVTFAFLNKFDLLKPELKSAK